MTVSFLENSFVNAKSINIGSMISVTQDGKNPATLTIFALDRNEYTVAANGHVGYFVGNGNTATISTAYLDGAYGAIVYTLQTDGQYYSSVYGYLSQLVYYSSDSLNDITNISLFSSANIDFPYYIDSATVATQPSFTGIVPPQATPDSIDQLAMSFVGKTWNDNGCWVLTSTIAAEAGASLPLTSTFLGIPGLPNGEWIVAFNGPAGQTGNWQSMVTAGDMIALEYPSGGGHITTCVSGSGSTAMLVDNATFVTSGGTVVNSANDGDASDIVIQSPRLATNDWTGVNQADVVIYRLDCPIVTTTAISNLTSGSTTQLASVFSATDPSSKSITEWQIYNSTPVDSLVVNGVAYQQNESAATAITVSSLSSISLLSGYITTSDTIDARPYNGSYWGDWRSVTVNVSAPAPTSEVFLDGSSSQYIIADNNGSLYVQDTVCWPRWRANTCWYNRNGIQ